MRLMVTGGGTGGHIYPALTTVGAIRERVPDLSVMWVGVEGSLESRIAEGAGIPFRSVVVGRIRRTSNPLSMISPRNIKDMTNVPRGVAQARRLINEFRPDAVLATGGYVAVPVGVAARSLKTPLVAHEQTVRLGLANRVLAKMATVFAASHEATLPLLAENARSRAVVTGNPVRADLFGGNPHAAPAALGMTGYDPSLPTVYVTGGSLGAGQINDMMATILPWLLGRANVIHQAGAGKTDATAGVVATLPPQLAARYVIREFVGPELADVLALADVVVSRSGAGTIAELTALGKTMVLIPWTASAGGEQEHNARHLHEAGAAVALIDDATAERLGSVLDRLLSDPAARAALAKGAAENGRPDAAATLANVVLSAAASRAR